MISIAICFHDQLKVKWIWHNSFFYTTIHFYSRKKMHVFICFTVIFGNVFPDQIVTRQVDYLRYIWKFHHVKNLSIDVSEHLKRQELIHHYVSISEYKSPPAWFSIQWNKIYHVININKMQSDVWNQQTSSLADAFVRFV